MQIGQPTRAARPPKADPLVVVGSFTTVERKARGKGLTVFQPTCAAGWTVIHELDGLVNPSYLVADSSKMLVYAAQGDGDIVSAFQIRRAPGEARLLGRASARGKNGVSAALDGGGRFIFVANYSSGSVSTLPVHAEGTLCGATHVLHLPGPPGPHRGQESSHPHDVVVDPTGRFAIVPDKGLDRIFVLRIDEEAGELSVVTHSSMRPGSGPRHIAFHPTLSRAYLVNEIDSTVVSLDWDARGGVLTPLLVAQGLPGSFLGENRASEIVIDPTGRFVYTSNRGLDKVARFALDASGDRLELLGWTPTNGRESRFMTLTPGGRELVVANEQSDTIVIFYVDQETGDLSLKMVVATPSPSSVLFL